MKINRLFDNCQSQTCPGDAPHIRAASERFEQVLLILFGNANASIFNV
jgi:hypothetical protein